MGLLFTSCFGLSNLEALIYLSSVLEIFCWFTTPTMRSFSTPSWNSIKVGIP
jgi:hypothetical protein